MKLTDYISEEKLNELKNDIGEVRFNHSLGVVKEAVKLAKIYKVDMKKAIIAGLLHDCGKFKNRDLAKKFIADNNLQIDEVYFKNYQLLHPILGVYVAKKKYGIDDEEILSGIRLHTTLKANPTTLEKIIYIADAVEPNRDYEGVEKLRELTYKDLDKSILISLENTIVDLIRKKKYIGLESLEARNYFLEQIKESPAFDILKQK